jgi:short-subunit dehydrogenase
MSFPLRDSAAVVTGAAHGIGRALAEGLAREGVQLALADIDSPKLEETAAAARRAGSLVTTHVLDVGDAAAVAALPEAVLLQHGKVDILINNAGVALFGTFGELTLEDLEWLITINFWGTVRMTKAFLPMLQSRPAAHIVNLSSIFGIIAPPGQTAYCASKFAVRGFSEALRHELHGSTVTLSVVHPGGIRTSIAKHARIAAATNVGAATAAVAQFDTLARTSPEAAARQIIAAIKRRKKRILIGADAHLLATVQRLFPTNYWHRLNFRQR